MTLNDKIIDLIRIHMQTAQPQIVHNVYFNMVRNNIFSENYNLRIH